MPDLPDVPQDDYRQYQADQFGQQAQSKIDRLGFEHAANSQISTLEPPPSSDALTNPLGTGNATLTPPPDVLPAPPSSPSTPTAPAVTSQPDAWPAIPSNVRLTPPPSVLPSSAVTQPSQTTQPPDILPSGVSQALGVTPSGTPPQRPITPPPDTLPAEAFPQQPQPTATDITRGGDLQAYARQAAQKAGIDPDIFGRQIQQESGFSPTAKSPAGAIGIAQFMPETAAGVNLDPTDPYASLDAAARLDAQNLQKYQGDYRKALAAYNAGGGNVDKYGGVPPFKETQNYVDTILSGGPPPTPYEGLARVGSGLEKGTYVFPVAGYKGDIADHWGSVLGGSDLFADRGTPVMAMQGGKVIESGWNDVGGNSVLIQGNDGLQYYYAHGDQAPSVKVGDVVNAGTYLMPVGNTGDAQNTGTHLHIGIGPDIKLGADKYGGTGGDYNAVGMLRDTLARQQTAPQATSAGGPQAIAPATDGTQTAGPGNFLDRTRQAVGDFFSGVGSTAQNVVGGVQQAADQAVTSAGSVATDVGPLVAASGGPTPAASQPTLSDQLTNPLGMGNAPQTEPTPAQTAVDRLKTAFSDFIDQVQGARSDVGTGVASNPLMPSNVLQAGETALGRNVISPAVNALLPGGALEQKRQELGGAISSIAPDMPVVGGVTGLAGGLVGAPSILTQIDTIQELSQKYAPGGLLPDPNIMTPEDRQRWEQAQLAIGGVTLPPEVPRGGRALEGAAGAAEVPRIPVAGERPVVEPIFPTERTPTGEGSWDPTASADPANRAVGRMLGSEPPPPSTGSLRDRFVRAVTNRYEAADRYQQDALQSIGHTDLANPPQNLDVSALLREQNGDPAAEVRINRDLKPIVQSVNDELPALNTLLIHRNNIDVARAIGDAVQADAADKPIASSLTDALDKAQARRDAASGRQAPAAQRSLDKAQAAVDSARQQILQDAAKAGQDAYANRAFSGGLRVADSIKALDTMAQELGPERMQRLDAAAKSIYDYLGGLRQTMVDHGVISPETAQAWQQKYPNWVPTRILDYLHEGEASGNLRAGTKIGLADAGIRNYTVEGTQKFREDPLGSIVGLTHQVETKARRNAVANAFVNLDQARPEGERVLQQTDKPATAGQPIVQRINNGTVERYVAPPELAAAINGPLVEQAPGFVRHWTNFMRNVTTVLNPAFALVRNPSLDVPEYFQRELSREGGNPLALPRITGELFKGYADAFQGLLQNEQRGKGAQQFIEGGGGGAGTVSRTVAERKAAVRGLATPTFEFGSPGQLAESVKAVGGNLINNPSDMVKVLKQVATLRPIAAVAERTEQGPRIASMRLAERRGATPARAVLNGRTVTLDFNEGGTFAKTINSFIPFTNAGIQGTAQVARAFRENPRGALASATMLVGVPAVMAEAWNNADPQRAQDYADVPQYLKDQGVVIMLPGEAPVDAQGNRHPQFQWINARGYAPFVVAARTAAHQALENTVGTPDHTDWAKALQSMAWSAIPMRAQTAADIPGSLQPQFIPGMNTGLQLALNKDIFRNRQIATVRNDQQASAASKGMATALTTAARAIDPSLQIRPSQLDFAVRDMFGGVGASVLGASNIGSDTGNQPQQAPVGGGLLSALGVRGSTGELGNTARTNLVSDDNLRYLQSQGVEWTPSPVTPQIGKVPLTAIEETHYQQLANRYSDQALQELRASGDLEGMPSAQKLKIVQLRVDRARQEAAADIRDSIPDSEYNRRLETAMATAGR